MIENHGHYIKNYRNNRFKCYKGCKPSCFIRDVLLLQQSSNSSL